MELGESRDVTCSACTHAFSILADAVWFLCPQCGHEHDEASCPQATPQDAAAAGAPAANGQAAIARLALRKVEARALVNGAQTRPDSTDACDPLQASGIPLPLLTTAPPLADPTAPPPEPITRLPDPNVKQAIRRGDADHAPAPGPIRVTIPHAPVLDRGSYSSDDLVPPAASAHAGATPASAVATPLLAPITRRPQPVAPKQAMKPAATRQRGRPWAIIGGLSIVLAVIGAGIYVLLAV